MLKTAYGVHTLALQRDHPTHHHHISTLTIAPSVSATNICTMWVCIYTDSYNKRRPPWRPPCFCCCAMPSPLSFFSWKKSYCDHFCMKFGFQSCTRCKERTRLICYILLTLSSPAPSATRGHGSICHCISSQIPACHTITQGLFFSTSSTHFNFRASYS